MFDIVPFLGGFQHVITATALSVTPQLICQPKPNRAILYVTNVSATVPLYMFIDPVPVVNQPHIIVPQQMTMAFTWQLDGPMTTYGWLGAFPSGSDQVVCVELIWIPQNLEH